MDKSVVIGLMSLLALWPSEQSFGATIGIVSMHYSVSHPVPHLHYEGKTVSGDVETLEELYNTFVRCREDCAASDGGPTAVLTMEGQGGDYPTGLQLAEFLRAHHIATVVERGAYCFSACAFAFLGGTALSSDPAIGSYIDRTVEPNSKLGFHAPYMEDQELQKWLKTTSPLEVLGWNRSDIALMVGYLVEWNVDPQIFFHMVEMGPSETYNIRNADDLYLIRAGLPNIPGSSWAMQTPDAVRNVCIRLLALYEHKVPILLQDSIRSEFELTHLLTPENRLLWGYIIPGQEFDPLFCGIHASDRDASLSNLSVKLYQMPFAGDSGSNLAFPILTFQNSETGFSSAGFMQGSPLRRIFQKGPLNDWFLPVGVDLDSLDDSAEPEIAASKFATSESVAFPEMLPVLTVDAVTATTRISHHGNVFVFEQLGSRLLFDTVLAKPGVAFLTTEATDVSFAQVGSPMEGKQDDFARLGFTQNNVSAVIDVQILPPSGTASTAEERVLVHDIWCAATFFGIKVVCPAANPLNSLDP